jgi:hypothetical protein
MAGLSLTSAPGRPAAQARFTAARSWPERIASGRSGSSCHANTAGFSRYRGSRRHSDICMNVRNSAAGLAWGGSPGREVVSSQGAKAPGQRPCHPPQPRRGGRAAAARTILPPLRGSEPRGGGRSRGSRPWLLTAAAPQLHHGVPLFRSTTPAADWRSLRNPTR